MDFRKLDGQLRRIYMYFAKLLFVDYEILQYGCRFPSKIILYRSTMPTLPIMIFFLINATIIQIWQFIE